MTHCEEQFTFVIHEVFDVRKEVYFGYDIRFSPLLHENPQNFIF
jgi:hypothetical protein